MLSRPATRDDEWVWVWGGVVRAASKGRGAQQATRNASLPHQHVHNAYVPRTSPLWASRTILCEVKVPGPLGVPVQPHHVAEPWGAPGGQGQGQAEGLPGRPACGTLHQHASHPMPLAASPLAAAGLELTAGAPPSPPPTPTRRRCGPGLHATITKAPSCRGPPSLN